MFEKNLQTVSINRTDDSFAIDFLCNCSRRHSHRRVVLLNNNVGGTVEDESAVCVVVISDSSSFERDLLSHS